MNSTGAVGPGWAETERREAGFNAGRVAGRESPVPKTCRRGSCRLRTRRSRQSFPGAGAADVPGEKPPHTGRDACTTGLRSGANAVQSRTA